jgi:alkylated DNA repair dioxygenase AlkB
MTNILPKDGEVIFKPNLYTESQSEHFFNYLVNNIKWQQDKIVMYGKEYDLPRLTSWYGLTDRPYRYSGIRMKPNVIMDEEMVMMLWAVQLEYMQLFNKHIQFNSVLLNYYRDGKDSVSWHADDEEELGQNPVIASLTFGSTRTFKFRHKNDHKLKTDLELTSGSLVIMAGETQHYWEHSIPKTSKDIGPRINLTFRNIN